MESVSTRDPIREAEGCGDLRFRTYAVASTEYKTAALRRLPADVALCFRLQQWPRYIWVVEAVDRKLRRERRPCVLGEAVVDATANNLADPLEWGLLALFGPSKTTVIEPDLHVPDLIDRVPTGPVPSGCELVSD
jgi:hypothetical protein